MSELLERNTKLKVQLTSLGGQLGKEGEGGGGGGGKEVGEGEEGRGGGGGKPPPVPSRSESFQSQPCSSPSPSSPSPSPSPPRASYNPSTPGFAPESESAYKEFAESFSASGLRKMREEPGSRGVSVRLPKIECQSTNDMNFKQMSRRLEVAQGILAMVERAMESEDPGEYLEERMEELEEFMGGRREELEKLIEEGDKRIGECEEVLGQAGL